MNRNDDRDPDMSRDAWTTDDIASRALGANGRGHIMPPSIVAAEEARLAARPTRVEPTAEERRASAAKWMDRLRAGARMNLFRESRRH